MNQATVRSTWKVVTLGDLITLQRGRDLPSNQRTLGIYPVVGSNGIVSYHSEYVASGPGVLVGRSGSVGKVTWVDEKYWPLNTSLWVRDFHGNDPKFIFYFLDYLNLSRYASGVSVPTLNRNLVHPIKVQVPPVIEQRAIAHVLRSIKEAKETRQRELTLERERKAALTQYLFTHGTRGEARKRTEIGEMPESWVVMTIGDLLNKGILASIQDGNHGERHPVQSDFQKEGIPFLTADCIRNGRINYDKAKRLGKEWLSRLRVGFSRQGDVLLTHKGTMGQVGIVGEEHEIVILSPQVTYYRIEDQAKLSPQFLFCAFQSPNFQRRLEALGSAQSTRAYVGITAQRSLSIPMSSPTEQIEIAEINDACNHKIESFEKESALLEELFKALLEEFMTGRLSALPIVEAGLGDVETSTVRP